MEKYSQTLINLKSEIFGEIIQKFKSKNSDSDDIEYLNDDDFYGLPLLNYDDNKSYRVVFVGFDTYEFGEETFLFHCCESYDKSKEIVLTSTQEYISTDELLKVLNLL